MCQGRVFLVSLVLNDRVNGVLCSLVGWFVIYELLMLTGYVDFAGFVVGS